MSVKQMSDRPVEPALYERITKREWYELGGFKNSSLFRRHNGRHWEYYRTTGGGW